MHTDLFAAMEELKWSCTGGGGQLALHRCMVGIRCVHYIEEKDGTARFATWGIYMSDSRLKAKQVHTSHTDGSVQPRAPLVYYSMFAA